MKPTGSELIEQKIKKSLADEKRRATRLEAFNRMRERIAQFWFTEKAKKMQERCIEIRTHALKDHRALFEQAVERMRSRGFIVHLAKDKTEAQKIIGDLTEGSSLICKSKTYVGKEIGIAHFLQDRGIEVIETDLGDRIEQLSGEDSTFNLNLEQIASLFEKEVKRTLKRDVNEVARAGTALLHEYMLKADWGLCGVNSISSEDGALFLVENEGNIRWVTSAIQRIIFVTGIEKVVETFEEASYICYAIGNFGFGYVTTYIDAISGPSSSSDIELKRATGVHGPSEVHMVLLDNGRRECLQSRFNEVLRCISCGACWFVCPVYGQLGKGFGYIHNMGRDLIFSKFEPEKEESPEANLYTCLRCGLCKEVCPVGIDVPKLVTQALHENRDVRGGR